MSESGSCFFSYAREDAAFVLALAAELRAAGADLWLDQADIRGGQAWDETVERALDRCRGVLVVLSPAALASHNVMDEVAYALDKGKHVVPLLHRPCEMPLRLRRLHYIDFTREREEAVGELLRALGIERDMARPPEVSDRAVRPEPPLGARETPPLPGIAAGRVRRKVAGIVALALLVVGIAIYLVSLSRGPDSGGGGGTPLLRVEARIREEIEHNQIELQRLRTPVDPIPRWEWDERNQQIERLQRRNADLQHQLDELGAGSR
jgi:hypothetical protein